jgi:cytochrome P450
MRCECALSIQARRILAYSHRMEFLVAGFIPYGKLWSMQRKLLNPYLHPQKIEDYFPLQLREAYKVVRSLNKTPTEYKSIISRYEFTP